MNCSPMMKDHKQWLMMLATLLVGLFLFLSVRAHDPYRWSDWDFGDAQTMLSLRQWQEGGWIHNYLLFKPQGYAPVIDLLDEPELRQHAHGISPGSSPRVGPRLLYTHYPAGYLIPYALLFKLGIDDIFSMRLLSIFFSISALALMYALFAKLTSPKVSLIAVLFYVLSPSFLGYADSLANQPLDDLFRFAFMLAVVCATRASSAKLRRFWFITAWFLEFSLSLSSYDSVFFLYLWLVGWDLIERRGFRWRIYLVFTLAPVVAHAMQLLQNVWYLGWVDASQDLLGTFFMKNGSYGGGGRLELTAISLLATLYMLYDPGFILFWLFGIYVVGHKWLKLASENGQGLPTVPLLLVLFLCGLGFIVVLPMAARMSYEGRQMIPFGSLLVSGCTWLVIDGFCALQRAGRGPGFRALLVVGYKAMAAISMLAFWGWHVNAFHFTREIQMDLQDIALARSLQAQPTAYAPVYFNAGGFTDYYDPGYVTGYPQIRAETEYYIGSRPILCFVRPALLAQDLAVMVRKAGSRFSPVLVTDTVDTMSQVLAALKAEGVLAASPGPVGFLNDKTVLDLSAAVSWRNEVR